jgi:antitoxin (DNA-binding transcriptional repressor) of toxin-antitoxin stability system
MTTWTIRDLRQRWPAAERALATQEEIVITRDGRPVAKLVRFPEPPARRPRFDPQGHLARLNKALGGKILPSDDASFAARRSDRFSR